MKLIDLKENDRQLDELLPGLAAKAVGSLAKGAATGTGIGGALAKAGTALGANIDPADLQTIQADPAAAIKMAKDRMDQKKQIQDAIKQTQTQLSDLQKQLAQLG